MSHAYYWWGDFDPTSLEDRIRHRALWRSWISSGYLVSWRHTKASVNKRLRHRARPNGRGRGR